MVLIVHWATHAGLHVIIQLIENMPMVHVKQSDKWAAKHGVWEACANDRLQEGTKELNKWM